jgi:hypothetical protein
MTAILAARQLSAAFQGQAKDVEPARASSSCWRTKSL